MKSISINKRRGISLIAVLGLLVLLVFLISSMYYMVTLESRSVNSYALRIQNRYDPQATFPYLQSVAASVTSSSMIKSSVILEDSAGKKVGPGVIEKIEDLSARVNLNSVQDAEAFDRFARAVLEKTTGGKSVSKLKGTADVQDSQARVAPPRGKLLVACLESVRKLASPQMRLGEAKKLKTQAEQALELLETPEGVKGMFVSLGTPYKSIGDAARTVGSLPAVFTMKELEVIAPYLTALSESPESFQMRSGPYGPRLTLDAVTTDSIAVWKQLQTAYPDKNSKLLMQYAANVVDFFDDNTTPTVMYSDSSMSIDSAVIGVEANAFITEVYPDSKYSAAAGDGGQFVELYNPWNKSLKMPGWTLEIYEMGGSASKSVVISSVIPANGTLVITDNYNRPDGNSVAKGLLSIFGVAPDGKHYQVYEAPELDLPDFGGTVALRDEDGNLIDMFRYAAPGVVDGLISYQRDDPFVRLSTTVQASPFAIPALLDSGSAQIIKARATMRTLYADKGLAESPLELLRVSTAFGDSAQQIVKAWQTPIYNRKDSNSDENNLDDSLVDLFIAGVPLTVTLDDNTSTYTRGKLNVNSCSDEALLVLDARCNGQLVMSAKVWESLKQIRAAAAQTGKNAFVSPIEFVNAVLPSLTSEAEFRAASRLLEQVTVNSSSYLAHSGCWREKPPREGMPIPGRQAVVLTGGADGLPNIMATTFE